MSRENVEFIEALFSGAGDMDKQAVLTALPEFVEQACDPDIEWIEDPSRADRRVVHGRAAVVESWRRWLDEWGDWGADAERFVDCGADVLVIATEHGRGQVSGAEVSSRHFGIYTIRDGKIARYREFYDEQAALDAVGLNRQDIQLD